MTPASPEEHDIDVEININPVEGLKQRGSGKGQILPGGRNQHQPSRGIETLARMRICGTMTPVEININPVEGLKQLLIKGRPVNVLVEININPVEGLKQQVA